MKTLKKIWIGGAIGWLIFLTILIIDNCDYTPPLEAQVFDNDCKYVGDETLPGYIIIFGNRIEL